MKVNLDGFTNLLSRMGKRKVSKIATSSMLYDGGPILNRVSLSDIYNSGGVGSTICSIVPEDMTREGFEIECDSEDVEEMLEEKLESLNWELTFREALMWARVYGGSIIVMYINDGRLLTEPVNTGSIKDVERLKVYEAGRSDVVSIARKYMDSSKSNFGDPELYYINTENGMIQIHESRVIRFDGKPTDLYTKVHLNGWGLSELQHIYNDFMLYCSNRTNSAQIINEFVIGVLKMNNLFDLLRSPGGEDYVQERLMQLDSTKSNENTVIIDHQEDYTKHTSSLTGVKDVLESDMYAISGASQIPATKLFGRAPAGQNSTGESDTRNYYDRISSEQRVVLKPRLMKLINYLCKSYEIRYTGEVSIEFCPLYQQSEKEVAETFKITMDGASTAITAGIYSPEEVRRTFDFVKTDGDIDPDGIDDSEDE